MVTATVEEVVGVIQGLAPEAKEAQATNWDLYAQTQQPNNPTTQQQIVDLACHSRYPILAKIRCIFDTQKGVFLQSKDIVLNF